MRHPYTPFALRISLLYAIIAAVWITASDRLIGSYATAKGLAFVVVTGLLLYLVLRAQLRKWEDEAARRVAAETALRKSEERLLTAMQAASDGIWDWDFVTDEVYYSPRWKAMFGYSDSELANHVDTWKRLAHPEDREPALAALQGLRTGRTGNREIPLRMRHKDGRYLDVLSRAFLLSDEHGRGERLVGTLVDVTERKRQEGALRENEARYRRLFEEALEGIAVLDPQSGTFLDCNQALMRMTGHDKEGLVGHKLGVIGGLAIFAQVGEVSGGVREERIVTKSGLLRDVEVKASKLRIGDRDVVLCSFYDVTEQRRGQHEREITLSLLRLLNDRAHLHELIQGVLSIVQSWTGCDAAGMRLSSDEDFPYFEVRGFPAEFVRLESPLCERDESGRVARDAAGRARLECMCGNVLRGRFDPTKPFFTPSGSFWTNGTTQLLASTNEGDRKGPTRNRCNTAGYESVALIPLRHGGRTIGLLQLNSRAKNLFTPETIAFLEQLGDQIAVTVAQRLTEEALRKSMDRYHRIIETAHEGIWSVDSQFRTTFVNRHLAEMLGYTPEEMIGRTFADFVFPDDVEEYRRRLGRATAEEAITTAEVRFMRRDGATVWTLLSASATADDDGNLEGALGMFIDITQRKQEEADRRKLEDQLHQAQKMEAVGLLAGGVAHDFNNHLTVILGYSNLLLTRFPNGSPDRTMIADIKESGERAAALTRQLLAFSRKQILAPKVINLNHAVSAIEKMLRRLIGEDIVLTTVYSPVLCQVRVDPGQLEQVVLNLAVNARDAMPKGGRLTIETGDWSADEEFCRQHPGGKPGRYALLSLTDTGTGMSAEVKGKIFEPFFTTKEKGRGTGLGLATVFGIVKQSDGLIDVYSELGMGTCFKIYLPAADTSPTAARSDTENAVAKKGSETVLLVEDEEGVRRIARLALEAHGYHVLEASSGANALSLAHQWQGRIQLLVTDIVMPGMSGRQLAEAFLAVSPGTRVLFMSGYTDDTVIRHGIVEASAAYLHKPFSPVELARKAREVLDGRGMLGRGEP